MIAILVCIFNLAGTAALFQCLRIISKKVTPRRHMLLVEEFLTTMDFCCNCCELAFIYDEYGTLMYGIGLFCMCLWWCMSFRDAAANPNKYVEDLIIGRISMPKAGRIILAQLIAGSLVYTFMRYLWAFGWSAAHLHHSSQTRCEADLQVTAKKGAIIEGVITFIDRVNALTLEEMDWSHSTITSSLLSTFLVISALHSTGGYFNPVLASSLKFGCQGQSIMEFIIVYWIGSTIGSIIALAFHRTLGIKAILKFINTKRYLLTTNKKSL